MAARVQDDSARLPPVFSKVPILKINNDKIFFAIGVDNYSTASGGFIVYGYGHYMLSSIDDYDTLESNFAGQAHPWTHCRGWTSSRCQGHAEVRIHLWYE